MTITTAALATSRLLVSQVKHLERHVRAETALPFAELQDLFETTRQLERQLADTDGPVAVPCAAHGCPLAGTVEVVRGSRARHCTEHARQIQDLLGDSVAAPAVTRG